MFLISQYWPVLAVVVAGLVPFVIFQIWRGQLSVAQIAIFLSVEAMLAVAAQHYLTEAGLIGVFAGEYNTESVEAFNQICLLGCRAPDDGPNVCPRYCSCVVGQGRANISYPDMLKRTVGVAGDRVNERWALVDQNCRRNLGLR